MPINTPNWGLLAESIKSRIRKAENLPELPLTIAKFIRTEAKDLNSEQKKKLLGVVRRWVRYVKTHKLQDTTDPFTIRFHLTQFAKKEFGKESPKVDFESVPIKGLQLNGRPFESMLEELTNVDILNDQEVAIYGGTARLALKIFAGVDASSELPINDVDVITNGKNPEAVAQKYKLDLAGMKIVEGDLLTMAQEISGNVDCSMNQVFIYNGNLYFSRQALEDVRTGVIRILEKNDALFGSEGITLPDGNIYINSVGFYRALSFLLRKKGSKILVSKENLEREKEKIGRYWLVLLFAKLLKIKDEKQKDEAVINWFLLAKEIGSTCTDTPLDFLNELADNYPEMSSYLENKYFGIQAQIRWLIGRFAEHAVGKLLEPTSRTDLPATYTPHSLTLPTNPPSFDLTSFWTHVNSIKI